MRNHCIYKHTNKTTGKSYIGLTCKGMQERLRGHIGMATGGSMFPFHCAIRKYGFRRNWESVVLTDNLSLDEASSLEEYYISELDTLCPNGYNLHPGGYTSPFSNPEVAARAVKKIKEYYDIPKNREAQAVRTKKQMANPVNRQKIADKAKKRWSNPAYKARVSLVIKKVCNSEEYKKKLSVTANNKKSTRYITIRRTTLSARQWDRKLGFPLGTISTRLNRGWSEWDAITLPCGGHDVKRTAI